MGYNQAEEPTTILEIAVKSFPLAWVRTQLHHMDQRLGGWPALFLRTWYSYQDHGGPAAAAGLAYFFFFSLFPLLLLLVAISTLLLAESTVHRSLALVLNQTIPISDAFVLGIVEESARERAAAGVIGAIGLVWSASAFFRVLIAGVNRAFGVRPTPRAIFRALMWVGAMGLIFVLAAALSNVLGILAQLDTTPFGIQGREEGLDGLLQGASVLLVTWAVAAAYRFIPGRRVKWGTALLAALPVAILGRMAQVAFIFYVAYFVRLSAIYGPLTAVVAVLLWGYITGSLFLLGAELAAQLVRRSEMTGP